MEEIITTCEHLNERNQKHLSPLACTNTELKERIRELCFNTSIFVVSVFSSTDNNIRIMNDVTEY